MAPQDKRRDLAVVALLVLVVSLPFLNKAYHIDEPFYLAIARQILREPLHPLRFSLNWYGKRQPVDQIYVHSALVPYFLALPLKITGGKEWLLRLFCIPLDIAAAWSLYLIASRFLAEPLLPVLVALASPGYALNMQHLMAEKWLAAFSFPALYALLLSTDSRRDRTSWRWICVLLAGLAVTIKYNAIFLLLVCLWWLRDRGERPWRMVLFAGSVLLFPLLEAIIFSRGRLSANRELVAQVMVVMRGIGWANRFQALLAFLGGCAIVLAVWPYVIGARQSSRTRLMALLCVAACALLFAPRLDGRPPVVLADWVLGVFLSSGAAASLAFMLTQGRKATGWPLWAPWAFSVILMELNPGWFISSRYVMFAIPPLIFFLAELCEFQMEKPALRRFYLVSLAGSLALTFSLGFVDMHYADSQRDFASAVEQRYGPAGRKIWFSGHWGLQYYLERAGAVAVDASDKAWMRNDAVVVLPAVNSDVISLSGKLRPESIRVSETIPLRLLAFRGTSQACFYGNGFGGFLPFAISREPLEEFSIFDFNSPRGDAGKNLLETSSLSD